MGWLYIVVVVISVIAILLVVPILDRYDKFRYYRRWYEHGKRDREMDRVFGTTYKYGPFMPNASWLAEPYLDGYYERPPRTSWIFKNRREVKK